jgi:hypothetical protein
MMTRALLRIELPGCVIEAEEGFITEEMATQVEGFLDLLAQYASP